MKMQIKKYPLKMWAGGDVDLTADMPMLAHILSVRCERVDFLQKFYLIAMVNPHAPIKTRQFTMIPEDVDMDDIDVSNYIGEVEMDTRASQNGWDSERPTFYLFEVSKK